MKNSEIAQMTNAEIKKLLAEEKMNLTKLRFQNAVASLENPASIRQSSKDIARLLTEINKRRHQEVKA
jgi:large subunit ribosomal protein L29